MAERGNYVGPPRKPLAGRPRARPGPGAGSAKKAEPPGTRDDVEARKRRSATRRATNAATPTQTARREKGGGERVALGVGASGSPSETSCGAEDRKVGEGEIPGRLAEGA